MLKQRQHTARPVQMVGGEGSDGDDQIQAAAAAVEAPAAAADHDDAVDDPAEQPNLIGGLG